MSEAYNLCVVSATTSALSLPAMEQACGALKATMGCFAQHLEELKSESAITVSAISMANLETCKATVAFSSCDADCSTIYVPETTGGGGDGVVTQDAFTRCLMSKEVTMDSCKLYQNNVQCLSEAASGLSELEQITYDIGVEALCFEFMQACDLTCDSRETEEFDAFTQCLMDAGDISDPCDGQKTYVKCLESTKSELDAITFEVYNQMAQYTCIDLPESCELKCEGEGVDWMTDPMTSCLMDLDETDTTSYEDFCPYAASYLKSYEKCLEETKDDLKDDFALAMYKESLPFLCAEFKAEQCELDCKEPDPAATKALGEYDMCMEKAITAMSSTEGDACQFVKDEFICLKAYAPFLSGAMMDFTGRAIYSACEESTRYLDNCDFDCGGVQTFVEEETEKKTGNTGGTDDTGINVDLSGSSALSQSAMVMAGVAATAVALLF